MIRLYDTKQRRKVDFQPREAGKVSMYVCGPTVYNRIHIGNARTFISFDIIRRYFEWRGFEVTFVQNVTDVDDKIIARAAEEGISAADVAAKYTEAFIGDMHALGVKDPTFRPKATEEISAMIALIERLIERGHAYIQYGDVYFSVRSDARYGTLSGRNVDDAESGHRALAAEGQNLEERKRDPLDFALWKAAKAGEPSWESPWGAGRPGWHIECSAMSEKYLGLPFDIHGGGADLVFPHHENECAQSECAGDGSFANYWMHSGMLQINSEKMSKSLGNFLLLHEVLEKTTPEALRLLMLQTHYRSPLDFSEGRLKEAASALARIRNAVENAQWICDNANDDSDEAAKDAESAIDARALAMAAKTAWMEFISAMDDDFNAPAALGAIFTFVGKLNSEIVGKTVSQKDVETISGARDCVVELLGVLGIDLGENGAKAADGENDEDAQSKPAVAADESANYPEEILRLASELANYDGTDKGEAANALLDARKHAREEKNWGVADAIRDGLANLGFTIEDTAQGSKVSFKR